MLCHAFGKLGQNEILPNENMPLLNRFVQHMLELRWVDTAYVSGSQLFDTGH